MRYGWDAIASGVALSLALIPRTCDTRVFLVVEEGLHERAGVHEWWWHVLVDARHERLCKMRKLEKWISLISTMLPLAFDDLKMTTNMRPQRHRHAEKCPLPIQNSIRVYSSSLDSVISSCSLL